MSIPFPSGQFIRIKKVSIKGKLWNGIQIIRNSHNERCKAESNENFSSSVAFVQDYFYLSTAPDTAGQIKLKGDAPSVHLIWYTQGKNSNVYIRISLTIPISVKDSSTKTNSLYFKVVHLSWADYLKSTINMYSKLQFSRIIERPLFCFLVCIQMFPFLLIKRQSKDFNDSQG